MPRRVGTAARGALATFVMWLLLASLAVGLAAPRPPSAHGFQPGGQFGATVIGQANFTSRSTGLSPETLNQPFRPAFDSSGNLWVADEANHRVVEFKPPFTDGEAASVEIGQPDFTSSVDSSIPASSIPATRGTLYGPIAVAFDRAGNLWVSDFVFNRVTEYVPPFTNGMNATLELGQPSGSLQFVSHPPRPPGSGLSAPVSLAFDSTGDLWVVDRGNNRVVEYVPPFVDGKSPTVSIGQRSLDTNNASTTQSGLNGPESVAFDSSGNLWVVDETNNRVLEFAVSSLKANGPSASLEIGQAPGPGRFSTNASGTSQSALSAPVGIAFDSSGDLAVTDRANNRILGFKAPFADGMVASYEIGQPAGPGQFTTALASLAQSGIHNPLGVAFDPSDDLWVADQLNGRVLEFSGRANATAASDAIVSGGGAASVDQTSTTGTRISVTAGKPGSVVNFYSARLESQPPGTGTPGFSGKVAFYHAKVSGEVNGVADVCLADAQASTVTGMTYFDGATWKEAAGVNSTAGVSVCGGIPTQTIASLTLLAIGEASAASTSIPTPQSAIGLLVVAVAFGAVAYAVFRRRRR